MKQFSIETDNTKQEIKTPTSKAKFEIPEIESTIEKIEEAEVIEEEDEEIGEDEIGFVAALLGAILGRRIEIKKANKADQERLAKEMEKIHPKERKRGCGCGW